MAQMIPPYISSDITSSGEIQIFDMFKNTRGTDDWTVFHSLNVPKIMNRKHKEIDFVAVAPGLGLFCLEVKSGRIKREKGVWITTDRFGRQHRLNISPFKQAEEGMYSLMDMIKNRFRPFGGKCPILCSYGVMFPQIEWRYPDFETDKWRVFDRNSARRPIIEYIRQLSTNTRKQIHVRERGHDEKPSLPTEDDIRRLKEFLRGDFEFHVSIKERQKEAEYRISRYTEEQYQCLDELRCNDRILFQGAAGTGKTIIAIEAAKRSLSDSERTMIVCFNKLLGSWIRGQLEGELREGKGYAGTFLSYLQVLFLLLESL